MPTKMVTVKPPVPVSSTSTPHRRPDWIVIPRPPVIGQTAWRLK